MRKTATVITLVILSMIFFHSTPTAATSYGWGYKKNQSNEIPDIGKYQTFLNNSDTFYVDHSGEKNIYLTFDNGYEQGYTSDILTVLKEENVPATFFVTGHYVKSAPDLLKRMAKEGHIIGNHSFHHPDFTKLTKAAIKKELQTVETAVEELTGVEGLKYLRPPRGTFNEQTLQWANELGYINIFWSLAFADWETDKQKGSNYAYEQVMQQIHPGAIILLHTVSSDNAQALSQIIKQLKKEGYQFKSLDDYLLKEKMFNGIYNLS